MTREAVRRSDRVQINIPLEVSGSDATGMYFSEGCITLTISRHGATLVLTRKLMPEQELVVRNLQNQKEAEVCVVGFVAKHEKGDVYGVTFTNTKTNIWDIEFPAVKDTKTAAFRLVMECNACKTRKVAYLNEAETEVFRASGALKRKCDKCRESTVWKESSGPATESEPEPAAEPEPYVPEKPTLVSPHEWDGAVKGTEPEAPARPRTVNDRKHVRSKMQIPVCVRRQRTGEDWSTQEEVETTDDCSRGGFSFTTFARFKVGDELEAAIPYKVGGANIFVSARVANARKQPDGRYRYGIAYVRRGYTR